MRVLVRSLVRILVRSLTEVSWLAVRVGVRRNVLAELCLVLQREVAVSHVAIHVLPVTLGHYGSSVGGQLPQVIFLGHLSSLLVVRLAISVQRVPHRRHHLGNFPEAEVGIMTLYIGLAISEEKSVGRDRLLWLVWVTLLFPP